MQLTGEINALFKLLDDPDTDIYNTVASKLIDYGKEIIPNLEQLWEETEDEQVQKRIETLIHRVHFQDLQHDFLEWSKSDNPELLRGAILVARYQYPGLKVPEILTQFDQLKRDIWLELNNYLTPLEQVNVFNTIIFGHHKLKGHELSDHDPKRFCINNLLESKEGNGYTLGIIILELCEVLDIPVFAVDIPRQFIFAYIDTIHNYIYPNKEGVQQIQFFYDPMNGILYSQKDVDAYLKKMNATAKATYFAPLNTKRIIFKMMEELALCYRYKREEQKADDIQELMKTLTEPDFEV